MGIWNHLPNENEYEEIEKCPVCGKNFKCIYTEQTPGFRDKEDKRCPYCGALLRQSMEWEFRTYKVEENV